MHSKFAIGDKVDRADDHALGTIVAIFTTKTGEQRYAVEMAGYKNLQISGEASLVSHPSKPDTVSPAGTP